MSGHSKWSKVKHQKAQTDAVKASAFTKAARAITISVSTGAGITDPERNFRLRLAIEKAHDVNMPKENIERAIAKAKGSEEQTLEHAVYEAYGPGSVAMIIEADTDNKQRTVSAVKNTLDHNGGRLVAQGAVSHLFQQMGIIVVDKKSCSYDEILELAVNGGAGDVEDDGEVFVVSTPPSLLHKVKTFVESRMPILRAEIIMKPTLLQELSEEHHDTLSALVNQLEDLDDVQTVHTNAS